MKIPLNKAIALNQFHAYLLVGMVLFLLLLSQACVTDTWIRHQIETRGHHAVKVQPLTSEHKEILEHTRECIDTRGYQSTYTAMSLTGTEVTGFICCNPDLDICYSNVVEVW